MKKYFTLIFFSIFILLSFHSFAQVDSSKVAATQRQIDKDQKRVDKLERKVKKQDKKQKRHEKKMARKERKMQRKLKNVEKGERRLDDLRKDSTRTGSIQKSYPLK